MKTITFTEVTVKDFLKEVLETKGKSIEELGYYFVIDRTFYPIDEVYIYTGEIEARNTYQDVDLIIQTNQEGIIWHKNN